jgi:transcriptional regulator with XRE-family HTH domain
MADLLSPQDIERLGAAIGLSVADICKRARVAHSTFTRWRKGDTEPTLDVYRRFRDVVLPPAGHPPANVNDVTKSAAPKRSRIPVTTPKPKSKRPTSSAAATAEPAVEVGKAA